ncbi:SET domain-containing protein [Serendipita vermifera]|nr:SET domain-containing protein [Serendipita vermifera]
MSEVIEGNGIRLEEVKDDGDPNDLLLTGFIFPDQPNHTIPAFVLKQTKDQVQSLAASTRSPEVTANGRAPYSLAKSDTAGQGMFAAGLLKTGDLILSERPAIVTRSQFPADIAQIESYLSILFARLPVAQQNAFSRLQNCKSPLEAGPLFGRLRTNGFTFSPYPNAPPHVGIFFDFSRSNHSCGPNAFAHFNLNTWAIELRASRAIKAGEEIFISYVDVLQDSLKRRAQLATLYDFTCQCKWCTLPKVKLKESDSRRADILNWPKVPVFHSWRSSEEFGNDPSDMIMKSIQRIVVATKEGLEPFTLVDVTNLFSIYAVLGDEKNFRKWRNTARDLLLARNGITADFKTATEETEEASKKVSEGNEWNKSRSL